MSSIANSPVVSKQPPSDPEERDNLRAIYYEFLKRGACPLNAAPSSILDGQSIVDIMTTARNWKHPYIEPGSSVYFMDAYGRPVRISIREGTDTVIFEVVSEPSLNKIDNFSKAVRDYLAAKKARLSQQQSSQVSKGLLQRVRALFGSVRIKR